MCPGVGRVASLSAYVPSIAPMLPTSHIVRFESCAGRRSEYGVSSVSRLPS